MYALQDTKTGAKVPGFPYATRPRWYAGQWLLDIGHDPVPDVDGSAYEVAAAFALLTPEAFYLAFTVDERIAIKDSKERHVAEFWDTFTMLQSKGVPIDPNLPSVLTSLEGLAQLKIIKEERIPQIQAGVAQ